MQFRLATCRIKLLTASPRLDKVWRQLFGLGGEWLPDTPAGEQLNVQLQQTLALPPAPNDRPLFHHPDGIVTVFGQEPNHVSLYFPGSALIQISLNEGNDTISGIFTNQALKREVMEDITLTSLAPLLRRRGYFLMHAAAMVKDNDAILLVGPSGSGKTTTALILALRGWRLLANDTVLLSERNGVILAHATPGDIRLRPSAIQLHPSFETIAPLLEDNHDHLIVARRDMLSVAPDAEAAVRRIYFPSISNQTISQREPEQRAIALARLAEQSLDRWDARLFAAHLDFLQRLSQQTNSYRLTLGRDVSKLPQLFEPVTSAGDA